VEKPEEKRTLGRPRSSWKYVTKMDFRDIVWGGMDNIGAYRTVTG
jgi:hypothetical protein